MNFDDYVRVFNSGDDETLCNTFYTDDFVMQSTNRTVEGLDGLREFLAWAHDGVREILRPQVVLADSAHILAELDIDFHALRDKPKFPFQPLKKGETITVKFFAVYTLRGDKVCHLKTATWPVGQGTSPPPS